MWRVQSIDQLIATRHSSSDPLRGAFPVLKKPRFIMEKRTALFKRLWKEEDGLTVLEYVVGAAALATVIALVFTDWGNTLKNALANVL
jgi:pilus assembly protein Flp/PilA